MEDTQGGVPRSTRSTDTRVFDTPELLELILSHLELLEIFRLQRVNHRFFCSINNAPLLKYKTFKAQPKTLSGEVPAYFDTSFCGRPGSAVFREQSPSNVVNPLQPGQQSMWHQSVTDGTMANESFATLHSTDMNANIPVNDPATVDSNHSSPPSTFRTTDNTTTVSHIDSRLWNPHIQRFLPGVRVQHLEYGWTLFTLDELPDAPRSPHDRPSWKDMLLTALPLPELRIEPAIQLRGQREHPRSTDGSNSNIGSTGNAYGWIAPPDRDEERRIAALHARMSTNLASSSSSSSLPGGRGHSPQLQRMHHRPLEIDRRRYGDEGIFAPATLPVGAAIRWAAARGEASNEGWVWGSSLQFAGGKKPFPGYATRLSRREGVTVGQLEEEMRGSKWLHWVVRRPTATGR